MPITAFVALALSVLMHVAWNLMARRSEADARFLWWAGLGHLLVIGPWALAALVLQADWSGRLALLLAITGAAEALYFVALGRAYRFAPVPLVYPIARSSPFLIALWTVWFFGETLAPLGWIGIGVCIAGVLWLGWTARGGDPARALPWAMLAALATSVYSTSNKLAVSALAGYPAQLGYATVAIAAGWIALSVENKVHTGGFIPRRAPQPFKWILGGIFLGNAYALVIYAMQFIPAAYAVAFTNAGIVLAGLAAMIVFGERQHWRARLAAMTTVCCGIALLSFA